MGLKAVSTPILASETSVSYFRGSFILAWQLWVAFGIFIGFVFNLIFTTAKSDDTTAALILGAPCVPCVFLLIGLWFCPESPRWYMRQRSSHFNPSKGLEIMTKLRQTEVRTPPQRCNLGGEQLTVHGILCSYKLFAIYILSTNLSSKRSSRSTWTLSMALEGCWRMCGVTSHSMDSSSRRGV